MDFDPSRRFSPKKTRDSGSTYLEVLIALFIMALAGGVLSGGIITGIRSFNRLLDRQQALGELLSLEARLTSLGNRIDRPYWALRDGEDSSENRVVTAWLDGDPETLLRISLEGSLLRICAGEEITEDSLPAGSRLRPLQSSDDALCGFRLEIPLSGREDSTVPVTVLFRGSALYGSGKDE